MKQTIKLNESQLKQLVTETIIKVIKEQKKINKNIIEEAFYNKEDGLAYKLMDVARSIFNTRDEKVRRDEIINLLNNSTPLYNEKFFGTEKLVVKVGDKNYVSLALDRSYDGDFFDSYYGDLNPIGNSQDKIVIKYYNNAEDVEKPYDNPYDDGIGVGRYRTPKGLFTNFGRLPSNPNKVIEIKPDLKLLNVFYSKMESARKNSI